MAKTREELKNMCIRLAKSSGATSNAGIEEDLNVACNIVASIRDWNELYKINTLALTGSDGDISYSLSSDVDEVEQMKITSPTNYAQVLGRVEKTRIRQLIPDKTIAGRSVPSRWYYVEPSIGSDNVETKKVTFDYRPDQAYTITYSYKANVPEMSESSDYPFFDGNYHHILVNYAMWKLAERLADPSLSPNYYAGEWDISLNFMKEHYQSQSKFLLPIPGPDEVY